MAMMRVAQISQPNAPFEIVERAIPEPGPGEIRIKVACCGVCHSDSVVVTGAFPGIQYPRVPGHEVTGVVDAVGSGVNRLKLGQSVGVGWHGGNCGECDNCRRGNLFACETGQVTGLTFDGGYGEYMIAPASAVARLPEGMDPIQSAPLLCAGLTTFNALRNSGARPGDIVVVHGIGGLGHLGIQFAAKSSFYTVAVARGQEKAPLAKELGADLYLDSTSQDVCSELQKLGGAKAVLATVTDGEAMATLQGALAIYGKILVIGVAGTVPISPLTLLSGNRTIQGWYSGTAIDSEDTLSFSHRTGVSSMNEVYPLEKANDAYQRMMSGKARFRVILDMRK
ncbi:alcohol dehydrogenase [Planctomicrobium sp. SH668]|uniref:alcohol dehydrogenase n=1 Tax=Planctomicrobium sp. SH668 TaxID=3448126 RepID=UPI003F5B4A15